MVKIFGQKSIVFAVFDDFRPDFSTRNTLFELQRALKFKPLIRFILSSSALNKQTFWKTAKNLKADN